MTRSIFLECCFQICTNGQQGMSDMNGEPSYVFMAPRFMRGIIIFSSYVLRIVVDLSMLMNVLLIEVD